MHCRVLPPVIAGPVPDSAASVVHTESGQGLKRRMEAPCTFRFGRTSSSEKHFRAGNIRPADEETATGDVLIPAGTVLTPRTLPSPR